MLAANRLDAVLLNAQHNFAWLTAGGINGVDQSRENGVATLMITAAGKRYILANNIELQRMLAENVRADQFEPIEFAWQDEKANAGLVLEKAQRCVGNNARIASDMPMFSGVMPIEAKIAACRYSLTTHEAARFRALGKDASDAISRAVASTAPGDTEEQVAEKLRHELGVGLMSSVVTLVAADERIAKFRHPVPTSKKWQKTLLLVTCAKRSGLIVSLSRMVSASDPDNDLVARTEAAAYVHAALLDATRPGTTGAELYAVAAGAYAERGFDDEINKHHQGGAAGYKTRDWVAHPASTETVWPDQAFAWNPSITGTKVEDTHIVTENGIEAVTSNLDMPVITTIINGRDYRSPGIILL